MGLILFVIMHAVVTSCGRANAGDDNLGSRAVIRSKTNNFTENSENTCLLPDENNPRDDFNRRRSAPIKRLSILPHSGTLPSDEVLDLIHLYLKAVERSGRHVETSRSTTVARLLDEVEALLCRNATAKTRRSRHGEVNLREWTRRPGNRTRKAAAEEYILDNDLLEDYPTVENSRGYPYNELDLENPEEESPNDLENLEIPKSYGEDENLEDPEGESETLPEFRGRGNSPHATKTSSSICKKRDPYYCLQQCDSLRGNTLLMTIMSLLFAFIIFGLIMSLYIMFQKYNRVCTCCKIDAFNEDMCYKMFRNTDLDIEKNTQMIRELKPCGAEPHDSCKCSASMVTAKKLFEEPNKAAEDLLLEVARRKQCLCPCPKVPIKETCRINRQLLSLIPTESNITAPSLKTQIKNAAATLLCMREEFQPKVMSYQSQRLPTTKICPLTPTKYKVVQSRPPAYTYAVSPHLAGALSTGSIYTSSYSCSTSCSYPMMETSMNIRS